MGPEHSLVRREQPGRLGHKMYAAEHYPLGISGGGLDDNSNQYNAGYWYWSGPHICFRLRLDKKPQSLTSVWQAMLDTAADTDIDWVVQLDEQNDN